GWSSQERGVRLGWKCLEPGWFGHNSTIPGAAAFVRVNPAEKFALVLMSRDHSVATVAGKLFGKLLPQFSQMKMPRPLSQAQRDGLELARFAGTYRSAGLEIVVDAAEGSELKISATRHTDAAAGVLMTAALRPAEDNVFYTNPPETTRF